MTRHSTQYILRLTVLTGSPEEEELERLLLRLARERRGRLSKTIREERGDYSLHVSRKTLKP